MSDLSQAQLEMTVALLLTVVVLVGCVVAAIVLPRVVASLRSSRPGTANTNARDRRVAWASVAGVGGISSIVGASLAYAAGGMAALPWMWAGSLVAAAIVATETWLATTAAPGRAGKHERGITRVLAASPHRWPRAMAAIRGLLGALALLLAFALLVGAEGFHAVSSLTHAPATGAAVLVAAIAVPLVFMPKRSGRDGFLAVVPLFLGLWAMVCVGLLLHDEASRSASIEALRQAFVFPNPADVPVPPAAAGLTGATLFGAIYLGTVHSLIAHQPAVGTTGDSTALDRVASPARAAALSALGPAVGGLVVATLTMLAFATTQVPQRYRIDDRVLSEQDAAMGASPDDLVPHMIFPGPAHSRGLLPHLKLGQLIVLPEDTPLKDGERYPMVFKAQPRGHMGGRIDTGRNTILVPHWEIAKHIDTVVFRAREPELARHAAYDVRVPVELTEELTWKEDELDLPEAQRESVTVYSLAPKDPEVDFKTLATEMSGPFLVVDDFHFEGSVRKAFHGDYGEALVMFEDRPERAPNNPVLRTVVSMGMPGPFFEDPHQGHGSDHADFVPLVMASEPGFAAAPGTKIEMRMASPARGLAIGEVVIDHNKAGEIRVPAWDFLLGTTHARLRHREDPSQDLVVPVEHRLADDGTLRFWSANEEVVKFKHAHRMRLFQDITLEVPDYVFEVEVRSGVRLPHEYADRQALVPLHPTPYAGRAHRGVYRPHPVEVFASDMSGPWVERRGGAWLGASLSAGMGDAVTGRYLLALVLVLLGAAGVTVAANAGGRAVEGAFGEGASLGYQVAFLGAVAAAPALCGPALTNAAVLFAAVAAAVGMVAVLFLARARARARR